MAEVSVEVDNGVASAELPRILETLDRFSSAVIEGKQDDMCEVLDDATRQWAGCGTVNADISPLIQLAVRAPRDLVVVDVNKDSATAVFRDYRPTPGAPAPESPGPQSLSLAKEADEAGGSRWVITGFEFRPA